MYHIKRRESILNFSYDIAREWTQISISVLLPSESTPTFPKVLTKNHGARNGPLTGKFHETHNRTEALSFLDFPLLRMSGVIESTE